MSELTDNIWAVVLADTVVEMYLTYAEAEALIAETLTNKLHEATIVTNDVARRMINKVNV